MGYGSGLFDVVVHTALGERSATRMESTSDPETAHGSRPVVTDGDINEPITGALGVVECENGHTNPRLFLDCIGNEWICPQCGVTIPAVDVDTRGFDRSSVDS